MKEFLLFLIPTIIVFFLIGVIESAMLFEKAQENYRKEETTWKY